MTRFEMNLAGRFGEFWKNKAVEEIRKMEEQVLNNEVWLGADMVARWKSNMRCLPEEQAIILSKTVYRDLFDLEATAKARDEENEKAINEYRRNRRGYTEEELFEMRSAFGTGTTVVDAITGETITL